MLFAVYRTIHFSDIFTVSSNGVPGAKLSQASWGSGYIHITLQGLHEVFYRHIFNGSIDIRFSNHLKWGV